MKLIFIVLLPLWSSLDYTFLYLSTKITPLDSSFVIATNLDDQITSEIPAIRDSGGSSSIRAQHANHECHFVLWGAGLIPLRNPNSCSAIDQAET